MTDSPERAIVLIVDDSPDALSFLTEALEQAGHSVLIATSGRSALTIAGRITPSIVLMDAVMPGLDGFETCRQMKAMAELKDCPVIFMTGLTETEHVVHALSSGGVDYVTKPIVIAELIARIRVHLGNARLAQSARLALDASGRHLLAARADGSFAWTTPEAGRLVAEALGPDGPARLAVAISKALTAGLLPGAPIAHGLTGPLSATLVGTIAADEHLFRLTVQHGESEAERLKTALGLTGREAEVLAWIAKGKANRDIGDILGLSARTVNKHLEQIYQKLGVENRASAALKAAAALRPD